MIINCGDLATLCGKSATRTPYTNRGVANTQNEHLSLMA